jgi:hypothetical protein
MHHPAASPPTNQRCTVSIFIFIIIFFFFLIIIRIYRYLYSIIRVQYIIYIRCIRVGRFWFKRKKKKGLNVKCTIHIALLFIVPRRARVSVPRFFLSYLLRFFFSPKDIVSSVPILYTRVYIIYTRINHTLARDCLSRRQIPNEIIQHIIYYIKYIGCTHR